MENRIQYLRKQSGFTQDQIAQFLGIHQSMIAKIEKGERVLTTVQLNKLSNLFACSEEFILGIGDDDTSMKLAFRLDNPNPETMQIVSAVNKVAANISLLNRILEADNVE